MHSLQAFNICIFPVMYFYSFLYYTDVGSVSFVLLTYYFSRREQHILGAVFGFISLLFRQNNIMWCLYVAGISAKRQLDRFERPKKQKGKLPVRQQLVLFVRYLYIYRLELLGNLFPYIVLFTAFAYFVVANNFSLVLGKFD